MLSEIADCCSCHLWKAAHVAPLEQWPHAEQGDLETTCVMALWMSYMTCACITVRKLALLCHWTRHLRPSINGRGRPLMQNSPISYLDKTEQESGSYQLVLIAGTDTVLRNFMTRS